MRFQATLSAIGGGAMDEKLEELRGALARAARARRGPGRRYPAALRSEVAAFARGERRRGARVGTVARRLGLPRPTLLNWLRAPGGCFAPVRVEHTPEAEAGPGLLLVSPSGHRVEGLRLAELVAVLRALA